MTVKVRIKLTRQTRNTFMFVELDDQGRPLSQREGKIGTLYAKQSNFQKRPDEIVVTIEEGE